MANFIKLSAWYAADGEPKYRHDIWINMDKVSYFEKAASFSGSVLVFDEMLEIKYVEEIPEDIMTRLGTGPVANG